jgi:hypothetical protein
MEDMDNMYILDKTFFLRDPVLRPNLSEISKKRILRAARFFALKAATPDPDSEDNSDINRDWQAYLGYLYRRKRKTLALCDEIHLTREQINDMLDALIKQKVNSYNCIKQLNESPLPHLKATIPPSLLYEGSEEFKVIFDVGSEEVPHKPICSLKNVVIVFDSPIEAYIFKDSFSEKPYHIFRICRMTALDKNQKMIFSQTYTDYDESSNLVKNRDPFNFAVDIGREAQAYGSDLLALYLAFQQALRMRPEEYHDLVKPRIKSSNSLSETHKPKKDHGPNNVRIVSNIYPENDNPPSATRVFRCECWGVSGHERRLKNGKTIFIKPYRKGRKRNDPTSYTPKNYLMADS